MHVTRLLAVASTWLGAFALQPTLHARGGTTDTTPPQFSTAPLFEGAPLRRAPLTAHIRYSTDEPARAELYFRTNTSSWSVVAEGDYSLTHDTMVLGMRHSTQHEIRLIIRDQAGNATEWPTRFYHTTPHLPGSFPPLHVTVNQTAAMEPGVTLLPARWSSSTLTGQGTHVTMLDEEGEVVWIYTTRVGLRDALKLRNGNILCLAGNRDAFEIDMLGNTIQRWWASNLGTTGAPAGSTMVPVDSFHHELSEVPPGDPSSDFITLSSSLRVFPNYPTSEIDPTQTEPFANVIGDVVAEFRRDGTLVRRVDLIDLLDPYRMCYNSLATVYNTLYGVSTRDWGHSNSAIVDTSDNTWIVSLRNQDCVVKVRRDTGTLVWIHGTPERWTPPWSNYLLQPIGTPFEWQFHQHWPVLDAQGHLSLFDNGNYRVIPPTPAPPVSQWYSRAVQYNIDPVAMTTEQVWVWDGGGAEYFSGSLGGALPLATTGNVLSTEGNKQVVGQNKSYARIQEITTGNPSNLVFELIVNDPTLPNPHAYNWNVYRARRLASVYPHIQ